MKSILTITVFLIISFKINVAQVSSDVTVLITTTVQNNPPSVTFSWAAVPNTTTFKVFRKSKQSTSWPVGAVLSNTATSFTDPTISAGVGYEYLFYRIANGVLATTFVYSGVLLPAEDYRGKLILVIDSTFKNTMATDIKIMESDLIGDGWQVIKKYVSRNDNSKTVKRVILKEYFKDTANVKAVYLFGHVPVPYSGNFNPDGHPDHKGAWPADVYYADIDSLKWTDYSVNNSTATRTQNKNIPGDGKFDLSALSSTAKPVKLMVGRVDLSAMPAFTATETQLLKQYISKSHSYKHKQIVPQRKALIDDNFGYFSGEAFASSGWRNFSALFGASNIVTTDYFTTMSSQSYLFSYACGGGGYTSCANVGVTSDFATTPLKNVFTMMFGSYFGDWDSQNNFLRAPLASSGWCLASVWSGRPYWNMHHMGMGDPIGYEAIVTQNNYNTYSSNTFVKGVHIGLMGDPSLRLHTVAPVSNLNSVVQCPAVKLTWTASTDNVLGYNVYRLDAISNKYNKLNSSLITSLSYSDLSANNGTNYYMVRAVILENGSGSYYNLSQGVFDTITANITIPTASVTANGPISFCQGGSVTLSVNSNSGYLWSTGVATQTISTSNSGVYNVTVTSTNGCTAKSNNITVTVYPLPVVNLGSDTTIASGGSITLNAGNAGSTYLWSTGASTQTISVNNTGTYWVSISKNGCIGSDTIIVTIPTSVFENAVGNTENILRVYPNPAGKNLNIDVNYSFKEEIKIVIYNSLGQTQYELKGTDKNYRIDVSDKAPGIYFIQLLEGDKIISWYKWMIE